MEIIRKYKKNDWWDLLIVIDQELAKRPVKETYFDILDELHFRFIEAISEGASFKIGNTAGHLLERFREELKQDPSFCLEGELGEFEAIVGEIRKKKSPKDFF